MATHELTLDVDKSAALAAEIITARTGDTATTIKATLLRNGAALSGATAARFIALKPDRTYADQSASISGSVASVTLDPKFLSAPGVIKTAYFRVTVNGKAETTPDIWINVMPDAESQGGGPTEPYISEVEALIKQLEAVKSQMQTATGSANSAASRASAAAEDAGDAADEARAAASSVDVSKDAANRAASAANAAASSANDAASKANAAKTSAEAATEGANDAASAASTAAGKANTAAGSANNAASAANKAATAASAAAEDAGDAADEARAAAGMVSTDKTIFLEYDTVGDVDYLTLTDQGED